MILKYDGVVDVGLGVSLVDDEDVKVGGEVDVDVIGKGVFLLGWMFWYWIDVVRMCGGWGWDIGVGEIGDGVFF